MPYKDPEKARACWAAYAKSVKGKARAVMGHKRYYSKPEKREKILANNRRWHAENKRYPRAVESVASLVRAIQGAIAEHEKQD